MAEGTLQAHYTLDHFEESWAVLEREDGVTFNVPLWWLPEEAQEGHVLHLSLQPGEKRVGLELSIDPEATEKRYEEARELQERLPKGPKGDIDL